MDWENCIICGKGDGDLKCPVDSKSKNELQVYQDFLNNVEQFKAINEMPVEIRFEWDAETLVANKAKWHKPCHLKFATSKLGRIREQKERKRKQDEQLERGSKRRQSGASIKTECIFCSDISGKLHECATINLDKKLRQMAIEMQDTDLLAKLAGGDLVAIDAKYHKDCLTHYTNEYRASQLTEHGVEKADERLLEARAFAELVSFVECSVEEGSYLFKLSELHGLYVQRLEELGISKVINKTRLKLKLSGHFQDKCQLQSDRRNTLLVFNEGLQMLLKEAIDSRDYNAEAITMTNIAKVIRRDVFDCEFFQFNGQFPEGSQSESVPTSLKTLISMLLNGTTVKHQSASESQACLTIAQLILFNMKKSAREGSVTRHSKDRKPPLTIYLSLQAHTLTRSKKLVTRLHNLGLSVSYDRVIEIKSALCNAVCKRFLDEDKVCPTQLRKGLFTVGAQDNIDHNPSSTTAVDSFHGTGISMFQFPTSGNTGESQDPITIDWKDKSTHLLPENYTDVPAVNSNIHKLAMQPMTLKQIDSKLEEAKAVENAWIIKASDLLEKDKLDKDDDITWAAYHASNQQESSDTPAVSALLPLFYEKAATLAMIKHGMDIQRDITVHLNPGQTPVSTFDQPLFALAKYVQWTWPDLYGEHMHIVMLGGLHIEMSLWNTLGDFLESSGWTTALSEASVATSGVADSFLKASHLTRTRHAHQVTALALAKLQNDAWLEMTLPTEEPSGRSMPFETWRQTMINKCPTFHFWETILEFELLVMVLIRSQRTSDFDLYFETLEALAPWFFALDHPNYARWIPIYIRDMRALPQSVEGDLKRFWVIQKTHRKFSCMPVDQAHEQNNKIVKTSGGAIGLTENPAAFRQWMIAGPEQARLLNEFERDFIGDELEAGDHHEQSMAAQQTFKTQVLSLCDTIEKMGNPFIDDCPELLALDTRKCANADVVSTVRNIKEIGQVQYRRYVKDVIIDRVVSIHEPIKRNSLPLFKHPHAAAPGKVKQKMAGLKSDCNLFGHLYIASLFRDSDPDDFFSHENHPWPPSLSEHGKLRLPSKKSDLMTMLHTESQYEPPSSFDAKIFDGAVIVHLLPTGQVSTFDDYCENVFINWIIKQLDNSDRIDIIWDRYVHDSLKESTREKRGKGTRTKVRGPSKLPSKFKEFLQDSKNKEELFELLAERTARHKFPFGKQVYITKGESVISVGCGQPMESCSHEEADSRICVHVRNALEKGAKTILVRTVDTDVIVILVGIFFSLKSCYPEVELWVAFGSGKWFQYYNINTICTKLGDSKCKALPVFHCLTGCDTTSQFFGKGKKKAWEAWDSYPSVTELFCHMADHPFQIIELQTITFQSLERFICVLYDKTSNQTSVNELRQELFSKLAHRIIDSLPPTQAALLQHVTRSQYQASIWTTSLQSRPDQPSPHGYGWTKNGDSWTPVWTLLPEAAKACREFIKCGCKAQPLCSRHCKCKLAELKCTAMCKCGGSCET